MYLKNASCIPFYLATWMLECMSEAFFVLNCENILIKLFPLVVSMRRKELIVINE